MTAEEQAAYLRRVCDWELVAHELAHQPVIWDEQVAEVIQSGWRGATAEEQNRLAQVLAAGLLAKRGQS